MTANTHARKLFRSFVDPMRLPIRVAPRGGARVDEPAALARSGAAVTRRRVSRLFRLASLLATLGMILGWMEVAVPDVHDGHGDAEPEPAWVHLSHDHAPASPEEGHAPQSPHTCHCLHAHAPAMPAASDVQPRPDSPDLVVPSTHRTLASVAPEPHFRPPVA